MLPLLLLLTFKNYSQSFKVSYSDKFKIVEKFNRNKIFKNDVFLNNKIYSAVNSEVGGGGKWLFTKLFDASFSLQINMFDENMNLLKQVDIEDGNKNFAPVDPVLINFDGTLLIAYYKPFEKKTFDLYISIVNPETLSLSKPIKIMSIPVENVGLGRLEEVLGILQIKFELSPDKSKLLLIGMLKENETGIFVLDKQLNIERQTNVQLSGSKYYLSSGIISNSDFVCLAFNSKEDGNLVLTVSSNGKKAESKINELENELLIANQLQLKLSKDQKTVYIFSTASLIKGDNKYSHGIVFSALDTLNMKVPKPKLYEFTHEFEQEMYEKGGAEKDRKNFRVFNFKPRLFELNNGNIIICGSPEITVINRSEDLFSPSLSFGKMTTTSKSSVTTNYKVGSIVSFLINKKNNEFNYSVIPRDISTSRSDERRGDGVVVMQNPRVSHNFSGFYFVELNDRIVFVYDDYIKNIEQDLTGKTKTTERQVNYALAEAAIDNTGKIIYRKKLADDPEGDYTFYLSESIIGNNNSYLIPIGRQGKGFNSLREFYNQWCRIELKNNEY